jgi:hypothetical protein
LTNAADVEVIAGETKIGSATLPKEISRTRIAVTAKQWKIHENFDPKFRVSDIAIIHLPVRLPSNDNTAVGFMYFRDYSIKSVITELGKKFPIHQMVGYLKDKTYSPFTLQYIDVSLADAAMCNSSPVLKYMDVNQFCVVLNPRQALVIYYLSLIYYKDISALTSFC